MKKKYSKLGLFSKHEVKVPIAVYYHTLEYGEKFGSLLIQHGSYQWVSLKDQPHIEKGHVLLYRGVGKAKLFRSLWFDQEKLPPADLEVWQKYLALQVKMLSDSVLSFNTSALTRIDPPLLMKTDPLDGKMVPRSFVSFWNFHENFLDSARSLVVL